MSYAQIVAEEIAGYMIDAAHASGDDPIVFVTGNNYMPPLRAYDGADAIWLYANAEAWDELVETLEGILDKANVYMGIPDYDNAIYVVDMNRFESVEDDNAENLSDEWKMIES